MCAPRPDRFSPLPPARPASPPLPDRPGPPLPTDTSTRVRRPLRILASVPIFTAAQRGRSDYIQRTFTDPTISERVNGRNRADPQSQPSLQQNVIYYYSAQHSGLFITIQAASASMLPQCCQASYQASN